MTWKELKDKVEKEAKLIRPELNVDDLEIYSIDIQDTESKILKVGFVGSKDMLQVWDSY